MAFKRARTAESAITPPPHVAPQGLVAAAARISMEGRAWKTYKFGDDTWQQEVWRLYDIIGELRFAANWVGSACSRVRIYVAKVDKNGRIQEETKTPKVAALADTLFGSPTSKAEALRLLGINLTIAGDAFIVGRSTDHEDSDEWMVVSCSELKRWGSAINYTWADGTKERLDPEKDLVIRVWTPHPRRYLWADSPTRAAMPMLWEIERLTRYVFAQIDSRLFSAGMVPIPKEVSFPDTDGDISGAEALTERLTKAGSASLKGEGTAAGVVPMFVEMPMEALGKINLINFSSELSQQARELRQEAIHRFALAMDMPPEILTGTGGTNHWSAWHIEESAVKVHIEPLMVRICDALTTAYLKPALKTIKEDEDRFVYWFDTAPLTVRPERLKDTLNMYEKGLVSEDTVRLEGDYAISDAPTLEERMRRFTQELMLRDPNLMQVAPLRILAGYSEELLPPDTVINTAQPGAGGAGPPPPPAPPTGIQPAGPAPLPQGSTAAGAPPVVEGATPTPNVVTAGATVPPLTTFVVANGAVLRALELAGKRLLTNQNRGQLKDVPPHELHTRLKVTDPTHAGKVLAGAWDHLGTMHDQFALDVEYGHLQSGLETYVVSLLLAQQPHDVNRLGQFLRDRGLLDGQS
jgi:hypothetical protein